MATAALICAVAIAGCSSDAEEPGDRDSPATDGATTTTPTDGPADLTDGPVVDGVQFPNTPEADQGAWLLQHLAEDGPSLDQNEVIERFHPEFLEVASGAEIQEILDSLQALGPIQVVGADMLAVGVAQHLFVDLEVGGEPWLMQLGLTDGQIGVLWFGPNDPVETPELNSWDEVESSLQAELDQAGAQTQVTVFTGEVADGSCATSDATDGSEPAPSGSTFKLAVLSAVVDAVEDGDLDWQGELTVTDEVKSLPSGVLQDEDSGTTVTVEEAAQLMIAISDNTATDMLIDAVGVGAVEQVYAQTGMDLERVTPLLTTRELFEIGWGAPQVLEQWSDAESEQRRELLDELSGNLDSVEIASIMNQVVWTEGAEYFFTADELCATMARLQQQAGTEAGEPIREILALSTFVQQPEDAAYLGFKGGSSTGAEAMVFYAEGDGDATGQGRVLVIQVADPEQPLPDTGRFAIYQAAVDLLVTDD